MSYNKINEDKKSEILSEIKRIVCLAFIFWVFIFLPGTISYNHNHYKKIGIVRYKDNKQIIIKNLINGEDIWWKSNNRINTGDIVVIIFSKNYTQDIIKDDVISKVNVIIKHSDNNEIDKQEIEEMIDDNYRE